MTWRHGYVGICLVMLFGSQATAAELALDMSCDRATERGDDEVFVVMAARSTSGRELAERAPGEHGVWHIAPGRAMQRVTFPALDVDEGESLRVVVGLFDEDHKGGPTWRNIAGAMLGAMSPSILDVTAALADVFLALEDFRPAHDFLGAFEVKLTKVDGALHVEWSALDGAEAVPTRTKGQHMFRLFGDGAGYAIAAKVTP